MDFPSARGDGALFKKILSAVVAAWALTTERCERDTARATIRGGHGSTTGERPRPINRNKYGHIKFYQLYGGKCQIEMVDRSTIDY